MKISSLTEEISKYMPSFTGVFALNTQSEIFNLMSVLGLKDGDQNIYSLSKDGLVFGGSLVNFKFKDNINTEVLPNTFSYKLGEISKSPGQNFGTIEISSVEILDVLKHL